MTLRVSIHSKPEMCRSCFGAARLTALPASFAGLPSAMRARLRTRLRSRSTEAVAIYSDPRGAEWAACHIWLRL